MSLIRRLLSAYSNARASSRLENICLKGKSLRGISSNSRRTISMACWGNTWNQGRRTTLQSRKKNKKTQWVFWRAHLNSKSLFLKDPDHPSCFLRSITASVVRKSSKNWKMCLKNMIMSFNSERLTCQKTKLMMSQWTTHAFDTINQVTSVNTTLLKTILNKALKTSLKTCNRNNHPAQRLLLNLKK